MIQMHPSYLEFGWIEHKDLEWSMWEQSLLTKHFNDPAFHAFAQQWQSIQKEGVTEQNNPFLVPSKHAPVAHPWVSDLWMLAHPGMSEELKARVWQSLPASVQWWLEGCLQVDPKDLTWNNRSAFNETDSVHAKYVKYHRVYPSALAAKYSFLDILDLSDLSHPEFSLSQKRVCFSYTPSKSNQGYQAVTSMESFSYLGNLTQILKMSPFLFVEHHQTKPLLDHVHQHQGDRESSVWVDFLNQVSELYHASEAAKIIMTPMLEEFMRHDMFTSLSQRLAAGETIDSPAITQGVSGSHAIHDVIHHHESSKGDQQDQSQEHGNASPDPLESSSSQAPLVIPLRLGDVFRAAQYAQVLHQALTPVSEHQGSNGSTATDQGHPRVASPPRLRL